MRHRSVTVLAQHSQTLAVLVVLGLLLAVGAAGEVAAHNPAGQPVPGCENGADAVGNNPNCHG